MDGAPVEVIEHGVVGPSGWRNRPIAIFAVAVACIVAFAGIGAALLPPLPKASPSPDAVANASLTAPSPTVQPTPQPTRPPWEWRRDDLLPEEGLLTPLGAWGVGSRVFALAQLEDGNRFARLDPGRSWVGVDADPAIKEYMGGTVLNGQLSFITLRAGAVSAPDSLELLHFGAAGEWFSMGASSGLGTVDGVVFVGQVAGRWVVAHWRFRPDLGEGAIQMAMHWSDDGRHWKVTQLPPMEGSISFEHVALFNETMVVLATNSTNERQIHLLLTSTDGRTWQRAEFDVPQFYFTNDLACDAFRCVVMASPFGGEETDLVAITFSELDPVSYATYFFGTLGIDPSFNAARVAVADRGFVVTQTLVGSVFASRDASTWTSFEVAPPEETESIVGFAIAGDTVIALTDPGLGGAPGVWRGRASPLFP